MPCYREWTAKRLENVVRVREYVTHTKYHGDDEETKSVRMVQECHLTTRELGEFMEKCNIEEFATEDDMDMLASMYASRLP